MRVLYVVGTNLRVNTSANISHNAFVQGLLENGCEVDIIMSSSSWGQKDDSLPIWNEAKYFVYNSVPRLDKFKSAIKRIIDKKEIPENKTKGNNVSPSEDAQASSNIRMTVRNLIKKIYKLLFNTSNIYFLDRIWLKNAIQFREALPYDIIISNSSPASSHKLVLDLIAKKGITETRWIQIWEDPWFFDLYGGHTEEVRKEEHRLLRAAKEIYYVSALTTQYQKIHFPDCAYKMKHIPLPYLKLDENSNCKNTDSIKFGYFGDYYSKTRNLQPFYEAAVESGIIANIYGDTDLSLKSTKSVSINGRATLDKLRKLQEQTDVLVHLCNLKGGQIPGKIYHYSATTKPIIFILDGTDNEKVIIKEYFLKFNRYHFCENRKEDILKVIGAFINGDENKEQQPVFEFSPKQVVAKLLF